MYTEEIINEKFNNAQTREMRYYLISHAALEIILEKSREDSSEEEYLEALIFSSYMVYRRMKHSISGEETKKFIIKEIYNFIVENDELDYFVISIDVKIFHFIMERFTIIENELSQMYSQDTYLLPMLLNNLYINPLNDSSSPIDEIIENMDFNLPSIFRIKFKNFLVAIDNIIKSFESQNI